MNARTDFSARIIEVDYERSTLLVRYEGEPPEVGSGVTPSPPVEYVALDIARWFVNGDRPDEFKLKEWAERLDREAISKAYDERSSQ